MSEFHGHLKDCDKDFFPKKVQNFQINIPEVTRRNEHQHWATDSSLFLSRVKLEVLHCTISIQA